MLNIQHALFFCRVDNDSPYGRIVQLMASLNSHSGALQNKKSTLL
jgi:hypothetical protein